MPIYEYRCQDCHSTFEKLVRNGSTELSCPQCGQSHLEQQLSTFSAHSGTSGSPAPAMGGCGGGMCRTPDLCGRN